jgi:ATP phosphoribosyltransferase
MNKLVIALPSKGRLQEQTLAFLADCGMAVAQNGGERFYGARMPALEQADIRLMASSEIVAALRDGDIHVGVTGEDVMREADPALSRIALVKPLGFGKADLVVAAPQSWIDVSTMADLEAVCVEFHARHGRRMRVATKYLTLANAFFERHGVDDYRLVESAGATEGAPASGAAEVIVDITTTGQTLADNHLKILEDGLILQSQAQIAASRGARWDEGALASLRRLLDAIEARARAKTTRLLRVPVGAGGPDAILALAETLDCARAAQSSDADVDLQCPADRLFEACAALQAIAGGPIAVSAPDYLFAPSNALFDAFAARVRA